MLLCRGHQLSRFREGKRHLRGRLCQRTFSRNKVVPELMEEPRALILTGVRISTEPGIRTSRVTSGLWEEHRVEDVVTPGEFSRDPGPVQSFYSARRHQLRQPEIQPSAAHVALAKLETELGDRLLLATQNVDDLYERADSQNVIHMHDELLRVHCSQSGQILEQTGDVILEGKCHCCQFPAPLRPHVVQFDEMPLGMDETYMALTMVDVFITVGASERACLAAGFVHEAQLHRTHTVELNLGPNQVGGEFEKKYYGPTSQVVPEFIEELLKGL